MLFSGNITSEASSLSAHGRAPDHAPGLPHVVQQIAPALVAIGRVGRLALPEERAASLGQIDAARVDTIEMRAELREHGPPLRLFRAIRR